MDIYKTLTHGVCQPAIENNKNIFGYRPPQKFGVQKYVFSPVYNLVATSMANISGTKLDIDKPDDG